MSNLLGSVITEELAVPEQQEMQAKNKLWKDEKVKYFTIDKSCICAGIHTSMPISNSMQDGILTNFYFG